MRNHYWLLYLWLFFIPAGIKAEAFVIKNYHIEVNFTEEGYADFEEIIDVEFSEARHGIKRFIPLHFTSEGRSLYWKLKNAKVQGYKFSTGREDDNFVIKIGDPNTYVEGRQKYIIRYRLLNGVMHFKEHGQFYWDLLGQSWDTQVENTTFRINFPEKVNLTTDDVYVYSGVEGTKSNDVEFQVFPNAIHGKATRVFQPREAMTIAVRFDPEEFQPPSLLTRLISEHAMLLTIPLFLLAGFFAKYYARNKKQTIMTEFFPPEGVSPAVAGGFVDHSVDNNDVLSLIPHLANKGYLRMEAKEGKGFFTKKESITFYKLKDAGADLAVFEAEFFNALFSSGDTVELDDLKDQFYTHMASVKASVRAWISLQGWYENDQKKMGCFTAFIGFVALAWGAYAIFARQNMDGIGLGITGLILLFLSSRFNKRSPEGNKTYQKLEGFRQFVARAEKPVIERLLKEDPLYYDKTMPFALAFGYLKQWNRQFEGLLTQPPSWYSGPMMYGTHLNQSWTTFSNNFPSEINDIGSVFSSTPGSSGSGGFGGGGGGGFSGGGGGGGGGSSW